MATKRNVSTKPRPGNKRPEHDVSPGILRAAKRMGLKPSERIAVRKVIIFAILKDIEEIGRRFESVTKALSDEVAS